MDRRSWPWKKKSSDKAVAEKAAAASDSAGPPAVNSAGSQGDKSKQDNYKKPSYVQISVESYTHLTGLEDQVKSYEEQVKTLEDEVKELNEKLSAVDSEMTTKENLVKQHAKVAEDAVSGWEKADLEALALKKQLESITLLKLAAEDRASHLDGALKECMWQIRNLKEEHEQKLHDVILAKTKQCDKIKLELESKITSLNQELFRSAAENAAISRSLQERSNMLIKISEEKSEAEADIEVLKSNIESCEREINSHKYELHIVAKELEIRNEEKNMCVRSADAANKQHLEGVKKIAKLEAECQRLRGLVRKKLPGPAALAQMKLEVENLGRDYGETRLKRSPVKPFPELSSESVHKYHKENELLAERLFATEEETKMLKEALAKRNSELQAARSICAKTVNRLQLLEAQVQGTTSQQKIQNMSHPPSLTSFSEDGNDDGVSCAGSWATGLNSDLSHSKTEKNITSSEKGENVNHLELMDDFLEMEKLACLSGNTNQSVSTSDVTVENQELNGGLCVADDDDLIEEKEISVSSDIQELAGPAPRTISEELAAAISLIYDFALLIGEEAKASIDEEGFSLKLKELSVAFDEVVNGKIGLTEFVLCLSLVFCEANKLRFNVKDNEEEIHSPDCIDKVALPENKVVLESPGERFPNGCSDFDIPSEGNFVPTSESDADSSWRCSLEEFEKLKLEKDKLVLDLSRCTENLESTECHLHETEQLLAEVKSQLESAQKLNSLAETQLKCMAESYKSLETRAEALQTEVNLLQAKIETLDTELLDEKTHHQEALARCKQFQEQLERIENCPVTDVDSKTNQEREITAAAEKLAECQETIFLLGKQLKGLRPQTNFIGSPNNDNIHKNHESIKEVEEATTNGTNLHNIIDPVVMDSTPSPQRIGSESPLDIHNSPFSPSDSEANTLLRSPVSSTHQPTISGSSSSSTPEKHSRVFTRFFSNKVKNGN